MEVFRADTAMNTNSSFSSRGPSKMPPPCQPVPLHQPLGPRFFATALLALLLLLALPVAVQAQFSYTTNNGTITITGYSGPGGDVTIPDTINGLPVTSIGRSAFSFRTSLTSVTIPTGIINIEDYAFSQCFGLASVSLPNSLTNIGVGAFNSCMSLASATIPGGVVSIGDYAFSGCMSLPSVTIPTGVISIGDYAFSGCASLATVTIPSTVISIGTRAFSLAVGGAYGFSGDNSLTTITVDPENLHYSSVDGVLFNKSQTSLLQYPSAKVGTSYAISNRVTSIVGYAFYGCSGLTNITIPSSVTGMGTTPSQNAPISPASCSRTASSTSEAPRSLIARA